MPAPLPRALPFGVALALFLLSGAGALVVETTWLRWLRAILGATAPAASATLVAFFLGQVLGAAGAARLAPRSARPLVLYGVLELVAAAWALAVPLLLAIGEAALRAVYDETRGDPAFTTALRFAAALAATLPASVAFGATWPALTAACVGSPAALGRRGTLLYGVNTAGAAIGAALASFWLPDALGVRAGHACGAAALAAAGASALLLARRFPARPVAAVPPRRRERTAAAPDAAPPALAGLAALSGFGAFAAEVLFVQSFALVLDQSVYAFGAVLVVVLGALALGALAVAAVERRSDAGPALVLSVGLGATALALAGFPALFFAATGGLELLASSRPWPGYLLAAVGIAALTAGPALVAAGVVFPATLAAAGRRERGGEAAARLGRLAAVNTAGALAGALAAPWLLLPGLGLWPSFAFLGGLYGLAALAVSQLAPRARTLVPAALAAGAAALVALGNPWSVPPLGLAPGERLVELEATPAGLVAVVDRAGDLLIQTDNHYALGGSGQAAHEERQGHLALLLRPGARRVAWIGSATGISPGAALAHPIERLALVELVPGVAGAARRHFAPWNRGVYADARSDVVLDDGRNFVRATAQRFDAIVADLFVPWQAGAGSLYTREHFAAARARLEPDGLFCQWLPLYQLGEAEVRILVATFLEVFPEAVLFRGDFYGRFPIVALVGYAGTPPRADAISAAASDLGAAGVGDRWVTHPVGVWSLYVGPLAPLAPSLAATPRNSDDRPRLEFLAARSRASLVADAFVGVRFASFARAVAEGLGGDAGPFGPLGEARLRAAAGGHALQSADALYAEGRRHESGRALAAAAALLPPELLAEAGPDPSAASVWRAEATDTPGR